MEVMGVISKVEVPTPWCASMVVVPKKTGAVRICVDLKPVYECISRSPPSAESGRHVVPAYRSQAVHQARR